MTQTKMLTKQGFLHLIDTVKFTVPDVVLLIDKVFEELTLILS